MRKSLRVMFEEKKETLQELFNILDVSLDFADSDQPVLEVMNNAAQKHLLRKPDSERWHIQDGSELQTKRMEIWQVLEKLGFIAARQPAQKHYEHVLILGATQPAFELRRETLESLVKDSNVTVQNVYLLGGKRALMPEKEKLAADPAIQTESDMMKADWENHQSTMPLALKDAKLFVVDAPMKIGPDGQQTRPNTQDTIGAFLKLPSIQKEMAAGALQSVLVISNQPHCTYQESVVRSILPEATDIETVGNAANDKIELGVVLDSVARWIYTVRQHTLKHNQTSSLSESGTQKSLTFLPTHSRTDSSVGNEQHPSPSELEKRKFPQPRRP